MADEVANRYGSQSLLLFCSPRTRTRTRGTPSSTPTPQTSRAPSSKTAPAAEGRRKHYSLYSLLEEPSQYESRKVSLLLRLLLSCFRCWKRLNPSVKCFQQCDDRGGKKATTTSLNFDIEAVKLEHSRKAWNPTASVRGGQVHINTS